VRPAPAWTPCIGQSQNQAPIKGRDDPRLTLITGAAHHFVTSSFANVPGLVAKERQVPWIEINPEDARKRGILDGAMVVVWNERGECRLPAVVTDNVLAGVAVSPKGRCQSSSLDGHNINWTTSDAWLTSAARALSTATWCRFVRPNLRTRCCSQAGRSVRALQDLRLC
jgi:anaerobic selenocysteine-containing dehydrogenase